MYKGIINKMEIDKARAITPNLLGNYRKFAYALRLNPITKNGSIKKKGAIPTWVMSTTIAELREF